MLPFQTLRRLTPAEMTSPIERNKRHEFDSFIKKRFGDSLNPPPQKPEKYDYYEDDVEGSTQIPNADDIPDLDMYLNMEVLLPQDGEQMRAARVLGRAKDDRGNIKGSFNDNPILNTCVYDVMFPDGAIPQYSANVIAENLFAQVDEDGYRRYQLLDSILHHRIDGTQLGYLRQMAAFNQRMVRNASDKQQMIENS